MNKESSASKYYQGYMDGMIAQRKADFDALVKWAEDFNRTNEEMDIATRIDINSFKDFINNILNGNEPKD